MTTIKKISTYLLGQDQIFVKIDTSEPGLFGWGSAAFAGHHKLIAISVDDYLTDFLVGKEITEIEDIWQTSQVQSSWRRLRLPKRSPDSRFCSLEKGHACVNDGKPRLVAS